MRSENSPTKITGVWSALPTPFRQDGALDLDALKALIRWQLSNGVSGVVAYGTTGEAPSLTREERALVTRASLEASPERPVMVGVGTNCTRETIKRVAEAKSWGAGVGLVVTPYYNKPSQEGLERHFDAVAEAAEGWPLVLYVVPGRAAVTLESSVIERLITRHDNIIGVKDATADLSYAQELVERCADRVSLLSGDDPTALAHAAVGGHGAISVLSNLCPDEVSLMWSLVSAGDLSGARRLARRLAPLARALFMESNPSPLKAALCMRFAGPQREGLEREPPLGLSASDLAALGRLTPLPRLPLTPLGELASGELEQSYRRYLEFKRAEV